MANKAEFKHEFCRRAHAFYLGLRRFNVRAFSNVVLFFAFAGEKAYSSAV